MNIAGVRWNVILTGAEDSTSDLPLYVSNLTASLRESTASFISLQIDANQQEDIQARPNGKIKVYKTSLPNGSPVLIVTANQQDLRLDAGSRHRTLTLTATTSVSFTPFSTINIYRFDVVSDRKLANGLRSFELSPLVDISPGDTADYYADGDALPATSYVIDQVYINANSGGTTMTITEAAA